MEKLMDLGHMDNYYEQIVKKKFAANQLTTLVMGICSIVLVIFLCVYFSAVIPFLVPVSLIALGVGVWLIYTLVKNSGVEYEYTFVMGEMRIERIKGKSRRRKITAFDVKDIDDFGKYIDRETGKRNIDPSKFGVVLHSEENDINDNTYYLVIHDKIRHKRALLTFTPNQTTLEKIRPFLSIELKKKYLKLIKEEEKNAKVSAETAAEKS